MEEQVHFSNTPDNDDKGIGLVPSPHYYLSYGAEVENVTKNLIKTHWAHELIITLEVHKTEKWIREQIYLQDNIKKNKKD